MPQCIGEALLDAFRASRKFHRDLAWFWPSAYGPKWATAFSFHNQTQTFGWFPRSLPSLFQPAWGSQVPSTIIFSCSTDRRYYWQDKTRRICLLYRSSWTIFCSKFCEYGMIDMLWGADSKLVTIIFGCWHNLRSCLRSTTLCRPLTFLFRFKRSLFQPHLSSSLNYFIYFLYSPSL